MSIYLLIAIQYEQVKECFAVTELTEANRHFETLKQIYGGANVTLASRAVDDVPLLIQVATSNREYPLEPFFPEDYVPIGGGRHG